MNSPKSKKNIAPARVLAAAAGVAAFGLAVVLALDPLTLFSLSACALALLIAIRDYASPRTGVVFTAPVPNATGAGSKPAERMPLAA